MASDTIFALSSGQPPAAVAIVRISGPAALSCLEALTGSVPEPRRATLMSLRKDGAVLDRALVVAFPGTANATGEDLVELHLHGGRAVVAAVLGALGSLVGTRPASPGEFTRRAFDNGRIDLLQAEGLADLLAAETEGQRRAAVKFAAGSFSARVAVWNEQVLGLASTVEARLDFSGEGDVASHDDGQWNRDIDDLIADLTKALDIPSAERLRDGVRVVIAGPPNVGKSTLLNALCGRDAAITSSMPGTTRDLVEVPVSLRGVPIVLIDSAGLRDADDEIEAVGVDRAQGAVAIADLVLWLGDPLAAPLREGVLVIGAQSDVRGSTGGALLSISAVTGDGISDLVAAMVAHATQLLPSETDAALNIRQRGHLLEVRDCLSAARVENDLVLVAEQLRKSRTSLDSLLGRSGVEDMLDALFGRFCVGK